jgi:hypothetical protein
LTPHLLASHLLALHPELLLETSGPLMWDLATSDLATLHPLTWDLATSDPLMWDLATLHPLLWDLETSDLQVSDLFAPQLSISLLLTNFSARDLPTKETNVISREKLFKSKHEHKMCKEKPLIQDLNKKLIKIKFEL